MKIIIFYCVLGRLLPISVAVFFSQDFSSASALLLVEYFPVAIQYVVFSSLYCMNSRVSDFLSCRSDCEPLFPIPGMRSRIIGNLALTQEGVDRVDGMGCGI